LSRLHLPLVAALLLRLAVSLWYAAAFPQWETLDEVNHYRHAQFIAVEGRLPIDADVPDLPTDVRRLNQFNQPPLVYMTGALALRLTNTATDANMPVAAPPPTCDVPAAHYFLSGTAAPEAERALGVLRGMNTLFGLLSVALTWGAVLRLSENRALADYAALMFALYPAAVALGAWFNNDALLVPLGAGLLLAAASRNAPYADLTLIALAALAAFTKLTGTVAVVFAALVLAFRMRGGIRHRWLTWGGVGLLILAVIAFIFWNMSHCGLPLCRSYLIHQTDYLRWSGIEWALRNATWGASLVQLVRTATIPVIHNTALPPPTLLVIGVGVWSVGMVGLLLRPRLHAIGMPLLLLCGAFALGLFRVFWLPLEPFFPVRYLALALPAAVYLCAYGYDALAGYTSRWVRLVPLLWLGFTLLLTPARYYRPLTALPPSEGEMETISPVSLAGLPLSITGYYLAPTTTGSELRLRFTTTSAPSTAYYVTVQGLNERDLVIVTCGEVLGTGAFPTSLWERGETVIQRVSLPEGVQLAAVEVGIARIESVNQMQSTISEVAARARIPVQK